MPVSPARRPLARAVEQTRAEIFEGYPGTVGLALGAARDLVVDIVCATAGTTPPSPKPHPMDATEPDPEHPGGRRVPLTPRHTGRLVAVLEQHGRGRIGLAAYHTGTQSLDDNPYRRTGRPYVELGALGEITLGRVSLFLNLENILDIRQTKYHTLVSPRRALDGRWTVDAWAPTDGFVVNGGVRLKF